MCSELKREVPHKETWRGMGLIGATRYGWACPLCHDVFSPNVQQHTCSDRPRGLGEQEERR